MPIEGQWLYVVIVATIGVLAVVRIAISLRRVRKIRLEGVEQRRRFDPIPTDTPLRDPKEVAQRRAFDSINAQFTVTHKVLIPLVLVVTGLLVSIPFLGNFPAAVVSLIVGASAVIIGVASRPFIENVIAGLIISYSRIIRLGDTVEVEEQYGTVEDISATHTTIKLWDWRRFVVPNARMLGSTIINHSLYDTFVWAHVEFWVAHDSDLALVEQLAVQAARSSPVFHDHEPPRFWIMEMSKEGARCWVAAWTTSASDAWTLKHDTRTALIRALVEHGIETHAFIHDVRGAATADLAPERAIAGQ